jgi:putative transposase
METIIYTLSIERYIYRSMTPDFPQFVPFLGPMGRRPLRPALCKLRHATLAQIEERLAGFLPAGCLEKRAAKNHSRDRLYPLHRVFWCWLWQILQANTACRQVVRQLQMLFSLHGHSIDEGTSAYCQSRLKIPLAWLRPLVASTAATALRMVPASTLLQGRCLKAVDGSSVRLADTRQNQHCFPQPHFQKPGAGFPLMRVVTLFCLASGAVLGCVSGHRFQSEISLAAELFASLAQADVVVADRGFGHFVTAALLQRRGIDLIARVPTRIRKIDFRKGRRLASKDALFIWQKSKRPSAWLPLLQWLALPQTLTIRVLQVRVCLPGMRVQTITLMTTLLDPKLYPAREIAEAFRRRWRQEMCFDDLKTTLNMAHLKSQTPAMAQKELAMFLITHNLLRCLMAQAAAQANLQIHQISFKGTLDAFRQCSQGMAQAKSKANREALWQEFQRILAADSLPHRPGRREPRATKRPIKYPKLTSHRRLFKDKLSRNRQRSLQRQNDKALI